MVISKQSDVHVDAVLSNLVIDYGRADTIGDLVLPKISVDKDTGKFYKWKRNNINITGLTTRRADRARAQEIKLDVELDDYSMEQHALRDFLEDTIRKNSDSVLNLRQRYAQQVVDIMDLVKEKAIRDTVFDTNNFATANKLAITGNDRWSVYHNDSDPAADIATAQMSTLLASGVWCDVLVMGFNLYQKLRQHPKVLASIQYVARTGIEHVSNDELCRYLGVSKIIVGKAVYNQSPEGATATNAFVWNNSALLMGQPFGGGAINKPAFGYQFIPSHTPRTVSRYTESGLLGEWVEVNEKRFMKLTFPTAAFLFDGADGAS